MPDVVRQSATMKKLFLTGIAALFLTPRAANARDRDNPYTEGVRDYYNGTCYRARPYLDESSKKAVLWERGFRNAQRRDRDQVDRSHCRGTTR
jgi:hypothetical protein